MSDVSALTPLDPTATKPPGQPTDAVADQMGADVFLQLLVAQLKYQDPTSPAEGTEFLAQTAQFTMVEKLTQLADQAEAAAVNNRNLGAISMVGRQVTWLQPDGTTGEGVVETARLGSAGPVLIVDGAEVPFDGVASVADAPPDEPPATDPVATEPSLTTDESTTPTATDGTTDAPAS